MLIFEGYSNQMRPVSRLWTRFKSGGWDPFCLVYSVLKIVKFSLLGACQQENIQMLCQVAKIHIWEQAPNIDFVSGIIQQY